MRGHCSPRSVLPVLILSAAGGDAVSTENGAVPPFTASGATAGSGSAAAPAAPAVTTAPAAVSGSAMTAPAASAPTAEQPPVAAATPPTDPVAPTDTTPAQPATDTSCEGFKLEGLLNSPGGEVLPNKCMPFHPTTNNPYAVRCVDAWPWYKTKFPGDEFCVLPPVAEAGIQYGVHPQGAKWFEQVSQGDMNPGEKLHFNCHIEYTSARASTEGAPDPSSIGTLHFANEAFTGEMCILFGSTAQVEIGAPVVDTSALPAFATTD